MHRLLALCFALAVIVSASTLNAQTTAQTVPDSYIVTEKEGCGAKIFDLEKLNTKKLADGIYRYDGDKSDLPVSNCLVVEPNYVVSTYEDAMINDPLVGQQWELDRIGAPLAWQATTGTGVVVAVLDTGATFNHPDLQGAFVSRGKDFINGDDDATDDHGHGTHVSGTIAANTNNGVGIAGIAYGAKVLPVKVLAANGSGGNDKILAGIDWASQQPGVKVISMSLGCSNCYQAALQTVIDRAYQRGVLVVAAAGNDGSNVPAYPAAYNHVLSVAATGQDDRRATFSNYGDWVDMAAPGVSILSTTKEGSYVAWNGTSMATPHVSAAAALLYALRPGLSVDEAQARLMDGTDLGSTVTGIGKRLNIIRSLNGSPAVPTPGPTATPPPLPTTTSDYSREVFRLINLQRTQNGLSALPWDDRIYNAAQGHNEKMNDCAQAGGSNCLSHQLSGEADPNQRVAATGFPTLFVLEDIGQGYRNPEEMVAGWMNSPAHKAAILDNRVTHGAAAFLNGGGGGALIGYWWTLDLVRSSSSVPIAPTPVPSRTPVPGAPLPWTGVNLAEFRFVVPLTDTNVSNLVDTLATEVNPAYNNAGPSVLYLDANDRMTVGNTQWGAVKAVMWGHYNTDLLKSRIAQLEQWTGRSAEARCSWGGTYNAVDRTCR